MPDWINVTPDFYQTFMGDCELNISYVNSSWHWVVMKTTTGTYLNHGKEIQLPDAKRSAIRAMARATVAENKRATTIIRRATISSPVQNVDISPKVAREMGRSAAELDMTEDDIVASLPSINRNKSVIEVAKISRREEAAKKDQERSKDRPITR